MSTTIEWTNETWNPVRGCSLVSAGCANCYAMKQAHRFSGRGKPYEGLTELGPQGPRWTGQIRLVPESLEEPLHWKKPCRVFVNSMSDLFHEDIPQDFIFNVLTTIWRAKQHTFQVLTKRPDRMREVMEAHYRSIQRQPLENLWLGVSVEDQKTADERILTLLETPASVRWLSVEPLLGPITLKPYLDTDFLDWVVVGGESGPGARPCDYQQIRSIVKQCKQASVPVFVKQLGAKPIDGENFGCHWPITDKKGGNPEEWPYDDLRVREYPR